MLRIALSGAKRLAGFALEKLGLGVMAPNLGTHRIPLGVGAPIFLRTLTNYYLGYYGGDYGEYILIDSAIWVANTGRYGDFMQNGADLDAPGLELEAADNTLYVNAKTVVDVCRWRHAMPTADQVRARNANDSSSSWGARWRRPGSMSGT